MASNSNANKNKPAVSLWLIAALGALVVVGIVFAISNHAQSSDPTLTAAPPLVSTPEHPLTKHMKSPEVYALEMKQAGMPVKTGQTGENRP